MGKGKRLRQEHAAEAGQAELRIDEPIDYQGPPLSQWQAAWLYAEVITSLYEGRKGPLTDDHRALIAWAIGVVARAQGLLPADPAAKLEGPQALAATSLVLVVEPNLNVVPAMFAFTHPDRGVVPVPGDPGFDAYRGLLRAITTTGLDVEVAELLRDGSAANQELETVMRRWQDTLALARVVAAAAVFGVLAVSTSADLHSDLPLAALGGHLNRLLADRR